MIIKSDKFKINFNIKVMKKIIFSLCIFTLCVSFISAQKPLRSVNEKVPNISKEERAALKPIEVKGERKEVEAYKRYSNLDLSLLHAQNFKIVEKDAADNVLWLKGNLDQTTIKTWEEKAQHWNAKSASLLKLNSKLKTY